MNMRTAYNELYLNDAMINMANMTDYLVNDCKMDMNQFFLLFEASGIAEEFACGNPKYVAGMSGQELAEEIFYRMGIRKKFPEHTFRMERTVAYWCGWILAYAQWKTAYSFKKILQTIPFDDIQMMYPVYHEMHEDRFVEYLCTQVEVEHLDPAETKLAFYRRMQAYSQRMLAEKSGVSLRAIQQYEQRQKNINKAAVSAVIALAQTLGCRPEDLMET